MPTPHNLSVTARAALIVGTIALAIVIFNPLGAKLGAAWFIDGQFRTLAFFAATLLAQVAFPRLRRNDIAILAGVGACVIELAQSFFGRVPMATAMLAGVVGVVAAWAPGAVEHFRQLCRTKPFTALIKPALPSAKVDAEIPAPGLSSST